MRAVIGATSFGFRYLLADERRAPPLTEIVAQAARLGLTALQVCENARPVALLRGEWNAVVQAARDCAVELHMGCMTLDVEDLARYLDLAAAIPNPVVRLVLEDGGKAAPAPEAIQRFLAAAAPRLEAAEMSLAIENHFHIPCRMLAEAVTQYPEHLMGFCIDSANSLRNWESAEQVFDLLESRGLQYHLKDYRVDGTNIGFSVGGAPLGEGNLNLAGCARRIRARSESPRVFLENWVPSSGLWEVDVAEDADWLERSLARARMLFG